MLRGILNFFIFLVSDFTHARTTARTKSAIIRLQKRPFSELCGMRILIGNPCSDMWGGCYEANLCPLLVECIIRTVWDRWEKGRPIISAIFHDCKTKLDMRNFN